MSLNEAGEGGTGRFETPGSSCKRVLVAEDDPMFRRILEAWLSEWGYEVVLAEDGAMAWTLLQREVQPQLLILDWMMPGTNGAELCRKVRAWNRAPYQYILLATAMDAKQDLIKGFEAGADDYLTKPFEQSELRARLRTASRILTLQDEQIQAQEQLRFQATHDPLTGLWNRNAIFDALGRAVEQAERSHATLGVLLLDIDHFKLINDVHGHLIGDAVLREVTQRILKAVRGYDSVGRYGGEEFLIVLPGCDRSEIGHAAERIRSAVDNGPVLVHGVKTSVTVSIGAATTTPKTITATEILMAVDRALYRAKHVGRNRIILADPFPRELRTLPLASIHGEPDVDGSE